jgi:acyl-CoA thioester hydrolase
MQLCLMPALFQQTITVGEQHLDDLDHVNNVVYLQWVQDVAKAHWAVLSNDALNRKYAWVVLRHELDYQRSAKRGDVLTVNTWVGETGGYRSVRHVEIRSADGANVVTAKTIWCLIDAVSFRPVRIREDILACLQPPEGG